MANAKEMLGQYLPVQQGDDKKNRGRLIALCNEDATLNKAQYHQASIMISLLERQDGGGAYFDRLMAIATFVNTCHG